MAAEQEPDGEKHDGRTLHHESASRQADRIKIQTSERKNSGGDEKRKGVILGGHLIESMTQLGPKACNAIS